MSEVVQLDHFRNARQLCAETYSTSEPATLPNLPFAWRRRAGSLEREKRHERWKMAAAILDFYERLFDVASTGGLVYARYGIEDAAPYAQFRDAGRWHVLLDKARAARAQLLLTPAPTASALNRKKTLCSLRTYVDVDFDAVYKLIAEDEMFLAANARRRGRRTGVQS